MAITNNSIPVTHAILFSLITCFSILPFYLKIHYLQPVFTVCLSGYRQRKYRRNFPIDQILQFLQMTVPPDALPQGIC